MDELISRQAAIDAIAKMMPKSYTPDGSHPADEEIFRVQEIFADCIETIEILPSAQPNRGKWIPHMEQSREYIGTVLINVHYDYWLCDTCGYRVKNGQPMHNFCPNCGADMRGNEDGTD